MKHNIINKFLDSNEDEVCEFMKYFFRKTLFYLNINPKSNYEQTLYKKYVTYTDVCNCFIR